MQEMLTLIYRYNSWATEQLLNTLNQLSHEQYTAPGCSGNGSIKETLAHFMTTQWGWFCWFDGSKPVAEAIMTRVGEEDVSSIEAARVKWAEIDRQTHRFIDGVTDDELRQERSFTTPSGISSSLRLGDMLFHVANHGTHTRAQIIAAVRRAGIAPGNYELLNYLLTHG